MTDILDIQEFFIEGGDQQVSHVLLHIAEPGTPEEKKKGYFFALAELEGADTDTIEQFQKLMDDAESTYYGASHPSAKDAFEHTIERVNRKGYRFLENTDINLHCFVGVTHGHDLSFTYFGKPEIAVLFTGKHGSERLMLRNDSEETGEQLFGAVSHGSLEAGDAVYIVTPHVLDYLSTDRIEKMILSRTLKESAEHIEKVLDSAGNEYSFGGILFRILPKDQGPRSGRTPRYIEDSETSEEVIEAPTALAPRKEKTMNTPDADPETNYRPRVRSGPQQSLVSIMLIGIGKAIVIGGIGVARALRDLGILLYRLVVGGFIILTNYHGQRSLILDSMRSSIRHKRQWVQHLPMISKLLLFVMIAFGLLFLGSTFYIRVKKQTQEKQTQDMALFQGANDKKTAADAAAIYGDTVKALGLLQEARTLLASFPKDTSVPADDRTALAASIEESLNRLRRITAITPEVVVDLGSTHPAARTDNLASLGDTLIAYGQDDTAFYVINTDTKTVEQKGHDSIPHLIADNTPKELDRIVFLTADGGTAEYDAKTGAVSAKELILPKENSKFTNVFVYNQRLYTLDASALQIYRHNRTQTGYDKGTAWIKTPTVLAGSPLSFAIDGDLYLLSASGTIAKYTAGEPSAFAVQGLDPVLSSPTVLWTYNGVNHLYILEPAQKRVVVLDKNGKLIDQYIAAAWVNPKDMMINEEKKTVFVLDQNKVYRFLLK